MAPCPACAEKLRLKLLADGRFRCPRCGTWLHSNSLAVVLTHTCREADYA